MKDASDWASEIKNASQGDDYYFYSHATELIGQIQADAQQPESSGTKQMCPICGFRADGNWRMPCPIDNAPLQPLEIRDFRVELYDAACAYKEMVMKSGKTFDEACEASDRLEKAAINFASQFKNPHSAPPETSSPPYPRERPSPDSTQSAG